MPEQILYFRGFPPPSIEGLAADSNVLADLKVVAGLSVNQVNELRLRMLEAKGFLDPKALLALAPEVLRDEGTARSLHRALRNLGPQNVRQLLNALSEQRKQKKDFPLDEDELKTLQQTLPALIQPYPALTRFKKADRLGKLTGQQLESVELICDLRPIFDPDRKNVDGMMPYTRLCIVATGVDGLPNSFEAELTQQQVHDLAEKASMAKVKLDVLRDKVEKWTPGGLPDVPLTRVPRKESSDA